MEKEDWTRWPMVMRDLGGGRLSHFGMICERWKPVGSGIFTRVQKKTR